MMSLRKWSFRPDGCTIPFEVQGDNSSNAKRVDLGGPRLGRQTLVAEVTKKTQPPLLGEDRNVNSIQLHH